MAILAQQGFGPKDKVTIALDKGIIQGAVVSPRYLRPDKVTDKINAIKEHGGISFFDPEYYATSYTSHPTPNLGSLEAWNYFKATRRSQLISGAAIPEIIQSVISIQHDLGIDRCIAPSVYIRNADSIDTAIGINFLNQTKLNALKVTDKPVYGSICIHRDALLKESNFRDILDGLTAIDNPLDGYYIVIGSNELQSSGSFIRSDIYHPEIIAASMYMTYVLSLNGSKVINGYCFMLSPLMKLCGAESTACGWSSGLRKFCIDRYIRQKGGGQQPNARYLSNALMSFIRQTDYVIYKEIVPEIANYLEQDEIYNTGEPNQTEQTLQTWEALNTSDNNIPNSHNDIEASLSDILSKTEKAKILWSHIQEAGFTEETEINIDRLKAIEQGVELFKQWAEIS